MFDCNDKYSEYFGLHSHILGFIFLCFGKAQQSFDLRKEQGLYFAGASSDESLMAAILGTLSIFPQPPHRVQKSNNHLHLIPVCHAAPVVQKLLKTHQVSHNVAPDEMFLHDNYFRH